MKRFVDWVKAVLIEIYGRLTPPTNDKIIYVDRKRKRMSKFRATPTEAVLRSLIQMVLDILLPLGQPFTAYGITLSIRSMVDGLEILTHPKEGYDGPLVGLLVYEIMSANPDWTSRTMPAEDGRLATHWIYKPNDEQFTWSIESEEEYDEPEYDEEYGYEETFDDYEEDWDDEEDDDEDWEDEDESLYDVEKESDGTISIKFTTIKVKNPNDVNEVNEQMAAVRKILGLIK